MPPPAVAAETSNSQISSAFLLYFNGKAKSARQQLIAELDAPATSEPKRRLATLEALLDICIHSYAQGCLIDYAPKYVEAAVKAAPADPVARRWLARKAAFYVDSARAGVGSAEVSAQILKGDSWAQESTDDAVLYLRRQVLAANVQLQLDRYKDAGEAADKTLSLVAALNNPQDQRFYVAYVLSDTLATLLAAGQTERAYGIYAATAPFIARALPPLSVDAVVFHVAEAQLLQETGRAEASAKALDLAIAALSQMELDPEVGDWLLGRALTLKAAVCVLRSDIACAQDAMAQHPYAPRFARDAKPDGYDEVTYLAARALVAAAASRPDLQAARALKSPVSSGESLGVQQAAETYRRAGYALALPPSAARTEALRKLGPEILQSIGQEPPAAFGAWRRLGLIDQLVTALAIGQAPSGKTDDAAATAFALMQLAGRSGAVFDADAFSLLGQARDGQQRRAIHQALRLKSRRDRLERTELKRVADLAVAAQPGTESLLSYDVLDRGVLRDFARRIDQADKALTADGVATSGANLTTLADFQAVLRPDEAALAVAPLAGDVAAYMCVRRDSTLRSVAKADLQRAQIDARVIRAGLTAGHAPSEALDAQFPVEASMRLYDVLIRPFEACLKPGDRIVWLSNLSAFSLPLSVLLDKAPPRQGVGYDLAAADWLVRRHAVSYAGSASLVVAARTGRSAAAADFDFLGVGDPVLTGAKRGAAGAADLSSLKPLPETRAELQQSAEGFRAAKLLMGDQATEQAFRGQMVGSYRFLSFATHGLLRADLPGVPEPALVLTPAAAGDPSNDGLLTTAEIADLNLAARFVALSACNTANYDLTQFSQDLPALASAFAVAGVPSTLATLWPVESETSKQVVAATFAGLRAGPDASPADALAAAQRAFLAAPPGKAFLHPRFWAPFVILGDGAPPAAAPAQNLALGDVAILTKGGGEVLAVRSVDGRTLSRFIGDPDASGKHASSVAVSGDEGWRRDSRETGAAKPLLVLGGRVLAGGYRRGADGVFRPTLESFDLKTGAPSQVWPGDSSVAHHAVAVGGAEIGEGKAVVVAVEQDLDANTDRRGLGVQVLETDGVQPPRALFSVQAPPGVQVDEATATRLGADILLTFSTRYGAPGRPAFEGQDDYDDPVCPGMPATWLELRDRAGQPVAARRLDGYLVTSAQTSADGGAVLGGALITDCAQGRRAAVISVDGGLATRQLYLDKATGDSEVRALGFAGSQLAVAAAKINVLDYRRPSPQSSTGRTYSASGMLLMLGADGAATEPRMLDSGGDLFLDDVAADDRGELVIGGALGGEAALFKLSQEPGKRR